MSSTPRRTRAALTLLAVVAVMVALAPSSHAGEVDHRVIAEFEGRTLDLRESWGEATACHVGPTGAYCFRTEAEMDAWLDKTTKGDPVGAARSSSCSSSLRLYDGTWFTGASLNLTLRSEWLNLSSFGFNQRTSSYRIGACSAEFADYNNGGGARYPGNTNAYAQATSMWPGWNNDVSSVLIY